MNEMHYIDQQNMTKKYQFGPYIKDVSVLWDIYWSYHANWLALSQS